MKLMRSIFWLTIILSFISCTSEEEKLKHKLTSKMDKELELLQEKEMERRDNPKCKQIEFTWEHYYYTNYCVFTRYGYDIKKTDSMVSPYTAKVQLYGIPYLKKGDTLQDCLNDDWKTEGREGKLFFQQEYAYQEGEWILTREEGRP